MSRLLRNRTFILVMAFVLGLVFSDVASLAGGLTMPALAVVLTVSSAQVSVKEFLPLRKMLRPVLWALSLNYLLLGALILVLAWWLMPTWDLWVGYVLVAAAPPGVAIIPFTYILGGDLKLSLLGTFGVYLLSLLLTPALVYFFTGDAAVSPFRLLNTMLMLILIPFVLSQVIRFNPTASPIIARWRGTIVNWGFFLVIFTVVGLNQEVFLTQPYVLLPVSMVAVASSFVLALVTEMLGKKLYIDEAQRHSFMLLSTIKTSAFAAAVGLNLYNEATSVPGAVISAWYALYFIYLGLKGDRMTKTS